MMDTTPMNERSVQDVFNRYRAELDEQHDKRERLIKASRDVTRESKRIINAIHRMTVTTQEEDMKRITLSFAKVRDIMAKRIAGDVDDSNYYRFHRAFTNGMQEYIEARTFFYYVTDHLLMTPEQIQQEIMQHCESMQKSNLAVDSTDYVLGVADLTGELMRKGVADSTSSPQIAQFLCHIEISLNELVSKHKFDARDMPRKLEVLRKSVSKVEKACYNKAVQNAEFSSL